MNTRNQISYAKGILQHLFKVILDSTGADDKKLALNQRARPGFKTEPVQAACVPCQMEAGHSQASLKKPLPEHGRTIHYIVPNLSWDS